MDFDNGRKFSREKQPKLKEIWRWVKNLCTDFVQLQKQNESDPQPIIKALLKDFKVSSLKDLSKVLEEILSERNKYAYFISNLKQAMGLPLTCTIDELHGEIMRDAI